MRAAGEVPQCKGLSSIPGGTFLMGCHTWWGCTPSERPTHEVTVSAFQVDRCDFTERAMEELKREKPGRFDDVATGCDINKLRHAWDRIKRWLGFATPSRTESCDKPLEVTWMQADAICKTRGMRLLTEAEYEYLARGPSHKDAYGTADGAEPDGRNAALPSRRLDDVGSFAPKMWGKEGVYDLAGGVWKWVSDWYDSPYLVEPAKDPQGPKEGDVKVLRGGYSRTHEYYGGPPAVYYLRLTDRLFGRPDDSDFTQFGVRCAVSLGAGK